MTPHYFCDQCGQGFETRRQLISHLPTHRSEVFACRQCEKKFISNTKLKNHVREKHSKENTCSLCGSRFGHLASLNNHVKEVHEKVKADPIASKETIGGVLRGGGSGSSPKIGPNLAMVHCQNGRERKPRNQFPCMCESLQFANYLNKIK